MMIALSNDRVKATNKPSSKDILLPKNEVRGNGGQNDRFGLNSWVTVKNDTTRSVMEFIKKFIQLNYLYLRAEFERLGQG